MFLFAPLLREIKKMIDTTVQAAVDTLKEAIVAEAAEHKAAVIDAVEPLVAQIAELKAAIEAGTDIKAIVLAIEESAAAVKEIVE